MKKHNMGMVYAGALAAFSFVFFLAPGAWGQSEHVIDFTHVAQSGNIFGNWTRLDHPAARGNPNAVLLVSLREGGHPPFGVYYVDGGWAIFNEDMSPIVPGTIFDVSVYKPSPGAFVLRAKGGAPEAEFEAPMLNESSQVRVTQLWESGGRVYNNHPIAVRWLKQRWYVMNTDGADIPPGAAFNITFVNPGSITPSQPPAAGSTTRPGTPLLGVIVAAADRVGPATVRDAQVDELLAVDSQGYKGYVAEIGPRLAASGSSATWDQNGNLVTGQTNVITVAITSSPLLGEALTKIAARGLRFSLFSREIPLETVPAAVRNILAKHAHLRNTQVFLKIEGLSLPMGPAPALFAPNQVVLEMLVAFDLPGFAGHVAWAGPLTARDWSRMGFGQDHPVAPPNVITVGVTTSPLLGAALERAAEAGMPLSILSTPTTAGALPARLIQALAAHRNLSAAGQYFVFDSVALPTTAR
jgi:hypothetical protein